MALFTEKLIMSTFQKMLAEMPFDKITVSALVRRAEISPNTFYYHYQDIYHLLDTWFQEQVEIVLPSGSPIEWKSATKKMLCMCQANSKTVYHVFDGLSRDRLERYVFSLTDDVFMKLVLQAAEGHDLSEERLNSIASFCRYAYIGFVMQFFWGRMKNDIDESVDQLALLFDTFLASAVQISE